MESKTILLHCHIFKNGGTTIDSVLKKNFGSMAVSAESIDDDFLSSDSIFEIIRLNGGPTKVSSISSHKLSLPPPEHKTIQFIPLVMLRDPLDRLGSMYSFYRRQEADVSLECCIAKRTKFRQFVEIMLSSGVDVSFVNLQSRFFLGNYSPSIEPSESSWPLLLNNLEHTSCVGLVEKFDDSMVLWEEHLKAVIPGIDFSYSKKNVSGERLQGLPERIACIEEELGTELVTEFRKRNFLDYRLYEKVERRLENAAEELDGFVDKLEIFRSRNNVVLGALKGKDKHQKEKKVQFASGVFVTVEHKGVQLRVPEILANYDRSDSGDIRIIGCVLLDSVSGAPILQVRQGQKVEVVVVVEAQTNIPEPIVGLSVSNEKKEIVFAMNSYFSVEKISTPLLGTFQSYSFEFNFPPLNSGLYSITPAFAKGSQENHSVLSCIENAVVFVVPQMISPRMPGSLYIKDFKVTG